MGEIFADELFHKQLFLLPEHIQQHFQLHFLPQHFKQPLKHFQQHFKQPAQDSASNGIVLFLAIYSLTGGPAPISTPPRSEDHLPPHLQEDFKLSRSTSCRSSSRTTSS